MSTYEYKVIPAPAQAARVRGLKTPEARFAHAFEEAVNAEAAQGWEYLRAETLPSADRPHWLSRTKVGQQHLLVFRRPAREATPLPRPPEAQAMPAAATVQPLRVGDGAGAFGGPGPGLGPARSQAPQPGATPLRPEPRLRTD